MLNEDQIKLSYSTDNLNYNCSLLNHSSLITLYSQFNVRNSSIM